MIVIISNVIMIIIVGLDIYSKVPQITTLWKHKVSAGISVKSYCLWVLSSLLYVLYCALIGEIILLIETTINIVLNLTIAVLAWLYQRPRCVADDLFFNIGYENKEISESDKNNHILAKFEKELDVKGEKNIITFYEEFVDCKYHFKDISGHKKTSSILLNKNEIEAINQKMNELKQ